MLLWAKNKAAVRAVPWRSGAGISQGTKTSHVHKDDHLGSIHNPTITYITKIFSGPFLC